jgi:hypothetical protein
MSMKTNYLLQKSGRNQFGDPGDSMLPPYQTSRESQAHDEQMRTLHTSLNEQFISTHRSQWLGQFTGLTKKAVWQRLHPYGLSLSTFYAQARECASFEEFLLWWLLSKKKTALRMMDNSPQLITVQLVPFEECGRYWVRYGKSERGFSTP